MRRLCIVTVWLGCGEIPKAVHPGAEVVTAKPAASSVSPPSLRLSRDVRPVSYQAELSIVPTEETFAASIRIAVNIERPVQVVWLNADSLTITRARLTRGGKALEGRAGSSTSGISGFVGIAFERILSVGPAVLDLDYKGIISTHDGAGVSRQRDGDDWYVFTDFEPLDARRAFPCFDEPSAKAPWQIALRVRAGDQAFSNTPIAKTAILGNGMKRVVFRETHPLPTYLVAFAVGPFEVVDAGRSPRGQTPIQIITPRGKSREARWAAESSAPILGLLEDYFGTPHPYEKLDVIAVPQLGGAMENVGLITFGQGILLSKPENETIPFQRRYASIAAHEFAHQWFGNLVTLAWWDDLWLNEAFATWITPKIIEEWKPSWGAAEEREVRRLGATEADSLMSARQIRQPILSNHDIKNAFDGITYGKGASVIDMFEAWMGSDVFRKGVQQYLSEHPHGNATAREFLAALSREAPRDVAAPFSTFLDQPGVPLIEMELRCETGRTPWLNLAQERYLPLGSEGLDATRRQHWHVPVCVRYPVGESTSRACVLMTERKGRLDLEGTQECPRWVAPNAGAKGYYRARLSPSLWDALLGDGGKLLTVAERLAAIGDLVATARAGKLPYSDVLRLVPQLAQDSNRHVVQSVVQLVDWLRDGELFSQSLRPAFAQFVRRVFGKRAANLGWQPRKSDDEDTRLLRTMLVPLLADQGEDAKLQREALRLASSWLQSRDSVHPDIASAALHIAAAHGDRAFFEKLYEMAKVERDLTERRRLLGAIGAFRDPTIVVDSLPIVLTDAVDARESMQVLWGATRSPATRALVYFFVKKHFDALEGRLPRDAPAAFPFFGSALCEDAVLPDVAAFFEKRAARFTGGPRLLSQALERLRLCVAFKSAQKKSVSQFFATWR